MYSIDEIKARLDNGEALDTIAKEMEDMLNAAQEARDAEIAKAKAAAQDATKRAELVEIISHVVAWANQFYPDLCADMAKGIQSKDEQDQLFALVVDSIIEAMDQTEESVKNPRKSFFSSLVMDPVSMMLMADLFNKSAAVPDTKPASKVKAASKAKSDDDILNDFLSKICH